MGLNYTASIFEEPVPLKLSGKIQEENASLSQVGEAEQNVNEALMKLIFTKKKRQEAEETKFVLYEP